MPDSRDPTLFRVTYPPYHNPDSGPKVTPTAALAALWQNIEPDFRSLSTTKKAIARRLLRKLVPHIRLLPDDSGRFAYLIDGRESYSPLAVLVRYFFASPLGQPEPVMRPPDAKRFLLLLKQTKFPAKYLTMIHRGK